MEKDCKDEDIANDRDEDHNNILQLLAIGYAFKTFRLVIIIWIFSFFVGIFQFILGEILNDVLDDTSQGTFANLYSIYDKEFSY